ncbi:MAG: LysR family transcriptional regulator, partial [Chryseobacterium sp.]
MADIKHVYRLETIIRKLENIGFGREGELRIGFLGSAAQNVMPELILKLNQSHPAIQTLLEEMSNRMQVEFILKDKLPPQ